MTTRRVLLTNLRLASRSGTELYVRDVALGLRRRGHSPCVFTTEPGEIAEEIRSAGVPVVERLDDLSFPPDVIHGHHHLETMAALLFFPGVPALFFSHDAVAAHDEAPVHPRIRRYVAVDEANHARLAATPGIAPERIRTILNFVDLDRFRPRPPLPARPERALLFSNEAREDTFLPQVRKACRRAGLPLDVVGEGVGRAARRPEEVLSRYDLVFAKGRCALEAAAVGCALVLCGLPGLGPPVSSADFSRLRRNNFGRALLDRALSVDGLFDAIGRYDPLDAAEVSRRVRAEAGLETALDQLIAVYAEAVEEARATEGWDLQGEDRAAAVYLRRWGGLLRERPKLGRFRTELARIQGSATRRARTLLLRAPAVAQLYRALSRMVRSVSSAPGGPGRPDDHPPAPA